MPWILLHQTWQIYIYIEQCTYTYGRLTPLAIEHRCLEYHYTKLGRSVYMQQCIYTHGRLTPQSMKCRCLEYHYTKLGRSIYISVQIQIYPSFQMRWTTETKTRNESIFSHKVFRFRYTPPVLQIRWTTETDTRNEFICSCPIVIFNYCHSATDHLYEYIQFTRYNLY